MVVTDPIADMLTRIRNANAMRYKEVEVPASRIKLEIARILKEEGYISDVKIKKDKVQDVMVLNLKYGENNHHKAEAIFKAFARALKEAVIVEGDKIPSSKGVLE